MACLSRLAVSNCCCTVVRVLCSVASLSAHWVCSQAYLSLSKMLYKGFFGNGVAYDVANTENGVGVGLRREYRGNCETKDCSFHG